MYIISTNVKMCLYTSRQRQTKIVGVITICGSITLIVSIQFILLHCLKSERLKVQPQNTSAVEEMHCNIRLDMKHEISYRNVSFLMMIFLVGVDIPSSMLLIWGSILKLKTYLFPWLVVNGTKMIIIVISVVVWSIHDMGGFSNISMLDFQKSEQEGINSKTDVKSELLEIG